MKILQARFRAPVQLRPGIQVNGVKATEPDTSIRTHELGVLVVFRGANVLVPWANVTDAHIDDSEDRPSPPRRGQEGPTEAPSPSEDGEAAAGEEPQTRRRRRIVRPAE